MHKHHFMEGSIVALKQKQISRKTGSRKKTSLNEDAIKKIMTQCDFVPDYMPNFKNLLKGESSIHNLKLQKSTGITPDKTAGKCPNP